MSHTPVKILLVDDDEPTLTVFDEALRPEGCVVVQARDGVEALDKFQKLQPDLVLLDLMLPRLNGFEVCARLRRHERNRHVPIIMLTGLTEGDARARAAALGADDFVSKPVTNAELIARIRAVLKQRPCHECHAQQQALFKELREHATHLKRTLRLLQRQPLARQDEQVTELLVEALETSNRLDEVLR